MTTSVRIKGLYKRDDASRTGSVQKRSVRAAVVLAGDDGRCFELFVRRFQGHVPPNQDGARCGTQSLFDWTFRRVERLIAPDRVITVVSRGHFRYHDVCRELGRRPKDTVVVQPQNKDTAPALLLSLTYLRQRHTDAFIAVFPSNHYVIDDRALMAGVETAFRHVERHPDVVVLLGVEPDWLECDYGYIVPGAPIGGEEPSDVRSVSHFIEKPSRREAADLIQQGALWNTSILVFRLGTLLDFMWRTAPLLPLAFTEIAEAIGTPREYEVMEAVYEDVPPVNFSHGVLESVADEWPSSLAVLRVAGAAWSDWCDERRILRSRCKEGA